MKTLVRVRNDLPWLSKPSQARLYYTDELPAQELWGTAFGFVFNGDKILLIRLKKRGWDIPGGKIDAGETPAQAAIREVYEEAYARVRIEELIGVQELEFLGPRPEDPRWPYPVNTQIFFLCRLIALEPFRKNAESLSREFFPPQDVMLMPTMENHLEIYQQALRKILPGKTFEL